MKTKKPVAKIKMPKGLREYMAQIGSKGGRVVTPKRLAHLVRARASLAAIRAAEMVSPAMPG